MVVNISTGADCGCFSSKEKANKYIGGNPKFIVKKIKVE
jgi:hypothetical protein